MEEVNPRQESGLRRSPSERESGRSEPVALKPPGRLQSKSTVCSRVVVVLFALVVLAGISAVGVLQISNKLELSANGVLVEAPEGATQALVHIDVTTGQALSHGIEVMRGTCAVHRSADDPALVVAELAKAWVYKPQSNQSIILQIVGGAWDEARNMLMDVDLQPEVRCDVKVSWNLYHTGIRFSKSEVMLILPASQPFAAKIHSSTLGECTPATEAPKHPSWKMGVPSVTMVQHPPEGNSTAMGRLDQDVLLVLPQGHPIALLLQRITVGIRMGMSYQLRSIGLLTTTTATIDAKIVPDLERETCASIVRIPLVFLASLDLQGALAATRNAVLSEVAAGVANASSADSLLAIERVWLFEAEEPQAVLPRAFGPVHQLRWRSEGSSTLASLLASGLARRLVESDLTSPMHDTEVQLRETVYFDNSNLFSLAFKFQDGLRSSVRIGVVFLQQQVHFDMKGFWDFDQEHIFVSLSGGSHDAGINMSMDMSYDGKKHEMQFDSQGLVADHDYLLKAHVDMDGDDSAAMTSSGEITISDVMEVSWVHSAQATDLREETHRFDIRMNETVKVDEWRQITMSGSHASKLAEGIREVHQSSNIKSSVVVSHLGDTYLVLGFTEVAAACDSGESCSECKEEKYDLWHGIWNAAECNTNWTELCRLCAGWEDTAVCIGNETPESISLEEYERNYMNCVSRDSSRVCPCGFTQHSCCEDSMMSHMLSQVGVSPNSETNHTFNLSFDDPFSNEDSDYQIRTNGRGGHYVEISAKNTTLKLNYEDHEGALGAHLSIVRGDAAVVCDASKADASDVSTVSDILCCMGDNCLHAGATLAVKEGIQEIKSDIEYNATRGGFKANMTGEAGGNKVSIEELSVYSPLVSRSQPASGSFEHDSHDVHWVKVGGLTVSMSAASDIAEVALRVADGEDAQQMRAEGSFINGTSEGKLTMSVYGKDDAERLMSVASSMPKCGTTMSGDIHITFGEDDNPALTLHGTSDDRLLQKANASVGLGELRSKLSFKVDLKEESFAITLMTLLRTVLGSGGASFLPGDISGMGLRIGIEANDTIASLTTLDLDFPVKAVDFPKPYPVSTDGVGECKREIWEVHGLSRYHWPETEELLPSLPPSLPSLPPSPAPSPSLEPAATIKGSVSLTVEGRTAAEIVSDSEFSDVMKTAIADMASVEERLVEVVLRVGSRRLESAGGRRLAGSVIADYTIIIPSEWEANKGRSVDSIERSIEETSTEGFKAKMETSIEQHHGRRLSFTIDEVAMPEMEYLEEKGVLSSAPARWFALSAAASLFVQLLLQ